MITRADKLGPTFVCPCSSSGKLSDFNVLHIREVTHKGTNDLQVRVLIIAPYANTYRLTSMSRFSSCPSQKRAYARRIKLELLTKYILPYIMRIYVACYAHCSVLLVGTVCVCQISWDGKTDEEKAREGEREREEGEKKFRHWRITLSSALIGMRFSIINLSKEPWRLKVKKVPEIKLNS